MEKIKSFFVTTLLGGVTVILPIAILMGVFKWIFDIITAIIQPLTRIFVVKSDISELIANILVILLILVGCFFVGVLIRTRVGKWFYVMIEAKLLNVLPGYNLIKETVLQLIGNKKSPFSSVALARIFDNDTLVTCFVTEEHDDGSFSVFVPTGPNPTSGNIYHLKKDNVYPVDVSVEEAMRSIISCGAGSDGLIKKHKER